MLCPNDMNQTRVNVKTIRQIVQIFMAFSENLNFTNLESLESHKVGTKAEAIFSPIFLSFIAGVSEFLVHHATRD